MRRTIIASILVLMPLAASGQGTHDIKPVPGSQAFLAGIVKRMQMVKDISPFTDTFIAERCFRYVLGRYPTQSLNLKRKPLGPKIAFNAAQQAAFSACLADDGYQLK